jgi:hypothetical protein
MLLNLSTAKVNAKYTTADTSMYSKSKPVTSKSHLLRPPINGSQLM